MVVPGPPPWEKSLDMIILPRHCAARSSFLPKIDEIEESFQACMEHLADSRRNKPINFNSLLGLINTFLYNVVIREPVAVSDLKVSFFVVLKLKSCCFKLNQQSAYSFTANKSSRPLESTISANLTSIF